MKCPRGSVVTVFSVLSPGAERSRGEGNSPRPPLSLQEFVIHTPCENAQKMYIGNALGGNYAAVFAQLIINGRSQGLSLAWGTRRTCPAITLSQ